MSTIELDPKLVRKLAALLKETGLNEIEYAEGDKRIRCVAAPSNAPMVAAPAPAAPEPAPAEPEKPTVPAGTPVTAPMVGTVYLAPEPGKPPYVKVGDKVKTGDTLLIIEAMKVMNPIKATTDGTVTQILAVDSKPIEFGETLMVIA